MMLIKLIIVISLWPLALILTFLIWVFGGRVKRFEEMPNPLIKLFNLIDE